MNESIISWNLPNLITVGLMIALIWVVVGFASHAFRRVTGSSRTARAGNLSGNGNTSGAIPATILAAA